MTELDWARLKALTAWTPLTEVSGSAQHLGGVLYKLGLAAYVTCVPYDRQLQETDGGPFVTTLLWAEADGAAKRAQLMQIEADESADLRPPRELLLRGEPSTYGEITRELQDGGYGRINEWAEYRLATDGAFVHRTINCPPLSFYFRTLGDDADPCYAIQYKLR